MPTSTIFDSSRGDQSSVSAPRSHRRIIKFVAPFRHDFGSCFAAGALHFRHAASRNIYEPPPFA
jgi:hypothetical protein